jgi:hypothetical protein
MQPRSTAFRVGVRIFQLQNSRSQKFVRNLEHGQTYN